MLVNLFEVNILVLIIDVPPLNNPFILFCFHLLLSLNLIEQNIKISFVSTAHKQTIRNICLCRQILMAIWTLVGIIKRCKMRARNVACNLQMKYQRRNPLETFTAYWSCGKNIQFVNGFHTVVFDNHSGFSFSTQIWHFCTILTPRVLKNKIIKLPPLGFGLTITGLEF